MQEWAKIVGVLGLALIIGTSIVLKGPVGRALADWIRGWSERDAQWLALKAAQRDERREWVERLLPKRHDASAIEPLAAEMDELKRRVVELEERLDFAERLLAQGRQADRLAPPR